MAAAVAGGLAAAQGALSPVAQNIVGLLKLEDTELAVDPAQAETLLPLWQAYRSLLNSDTTAPAELEALQAQISQALSDEQQAAIAAMDLSPEDMSAVEELGVTHSVERPVNAVTPAALDPASVVPAQAARPAG